MASKKTLDKRTWVNIALGTVAAIAIVFGVKQCSDKKNAREEAQIWHETVDERNAAVTDASNAISAANGKIRDLRDSVAVCKDLIAEKDSTIAGLRDSLTVCRDAKACACTGKVGCDCKEAKGCDKCKKQAKPVAKKPVAKKPACKPAPAKPAPVKPAPVKPAPVKPAQPAKPAPVKPAPVKPAPVKDCKPAVVVKTDKDTVIVRGPVEKPTQTVVITGDNNGNVIVNSNGVVNANGNVNGHDNNVNSAAANRKQRMYQNACRTTTTVVLGTRSKCY